MLLLGALNGETSLRGMWMWACNHWRQIKLPLGFIGHGDPPVYSELWTVVSALETGLLEAAYGAWVASWSDEIPQALSVDGKTLRGSGRTRTAEPARQVVAAVGQDLQEVLGQCEAVGGDQVEAALGVLRAIPLAGKLVIADAGLLCRPFVKAVLERGGDYLGLVKENQPQLKQALDEWIAEDAFPPGARATGG